MGSDQLYTTNRARLAYVGSCLVGGALHWYKHYAASHAAVETIAYWDAFQADMDRQFEDPLRQAKARNELTTLRQGTNENLNTFILRFEDLHRELGYPEEALLEPFRTALVPSLRNALLMAHDYDDGSLADTIAKTRKLAIALERIQTAPNPRPSSTPFRPTFSATPAKPRVTCSIHPDMGHDDAHCRTQHPELPRPARRGWGANPSPVTPSPSGGGRRVGVVDTEEPTAIASTGSDFPPALGN
jgi:hypothetical protein